jgi:integrase
MLYQRGKGKITRQKNGKVKRERTWWYRFRFGGRIVHESAKTTNKTIAREAEKMRRRQLEESWNRITPRTLPLTFAKAAREWFEGREEAAKTREAEKMRLSANTLSSNRVSLQHLLPAFGSRLLWPSKASDTTPEDVAAYQQDRLREGAQGRTVNIEVQVLRQILKAQKCWRHLDGEVHSLKERKDVGRALKPEEEERLLAECARTDSACYTATVLALNTAMRRDEIRKLCWQQVGLFECVLTVRDSKTPAGKGRVIPLNPSAVRALADWGRRLSVSQPDHYVFPWCESRQMDPSRPTQGWRTAWRNATRWVVCPKCGERQPPAASCRRPECKADLADVKNALAGLRFHDLRHTASPSWPSPKLRNRPS